jgi:hypothetical protein
LEVRELTVDEYNMWDKLVEDSPNGTIFHKSFWLVACSKSLNVPLRIYGCFEDGSLAAGCSLFACGSRLFKKGQSTIGMSPYGGFVLGQLRSVSVRQKEHAYVRTVVCLNQALGAQGFGYVRIVGSPDLIDVRPFTWNGWNGRIHYSYYFDLEGNVDERISRDARKFVRRAEKKGITAKKLENPDVATYYELFAMTFRRQNLKPPATANFFEEIIGALKAEGAMEMWIAETPSGEPAAGNIIIWDHKRVYGWSAASHTSYLDTGAPSLLLYEIFRELGERGFKTIDLRGADAPHIADFLANFNPRLLPYYFLEKKAKWVRMGGYVNALFRDLLAQPFEETVVHAFL